jgi:uncharacterized SAM-binding protein YcdF (DUF218 family)
VIARLVAAITAALALAWLAGFVWFVRLASAPADRVPHADGIVVLTGGSNRIEQGLRLLADGRAPRLLVSGVIPGTEVQRLARGAGIDPAQVAGQVTLGQSAISTRGNAEETVDWAARYNLHSLIVVTAFYHMPRALAELRRALPGTDLYPAPVQPDPPPAGDNGRTLTLLASEYTKFLAVWLGIPRHAVDRRPGEGLK